MVIIVIIIGGSRRGVWPTSLAGGAFLCREKCRPLEMRNVDFLHVEEGGWRWGKNPTRSADSDPLAMADTRQFRRGHCERESRVSPRVQITKPVNTSAPDGVAHPLSPSYTCYAASCIFASNSDSGLVRVWNVAGRFIQWRLICVCDCGQRRHTCLKVRKLETILFGKFVRIWTLL